MTALSFTHKKVTFQVSKPKQKHSPVQEWQWQNSSKLLWYDDERWTPCMAVINEPPWLLSTHRHKDGKFIFINIKFVLSCCLLSWQSEREFRPFDSSEWSRRRGENSLDGSRMSWQRLYWWAEHHRPGDERERLNGMENMKLNMFFFWYVKHQNIFIAKKSFFSFSTFFFFGLLRCCRRHRPDGLRGWHFLRFMPFHYWLLCFIDLSLSPGFHFDMCVLRLCDKKYLWLETWKIHRRFPLSQRKWKKRAMSTEISTVNFIIEHEAASVSEVWEVIISLEGVWWPNIHLFTHWRQKAKRVVMRWGRKSEKISHFSLSPSSHLYEHNTHSFVCAHSIIISSALK